MEEITKYILTLLETIELELDLLRVKTGQLGRGIVAFLIGCLFLFVGVLVLTGAVYLVLSQMIGRLGAALLAAGILLLCGGGFLWTARKTLK
jgi:hypothetical protein